MLIIQVKSDHLKKYSGLYTLEFFKILTIWPSVFHENTSALLAAVINSDIQARIRLSQQYHCGMSYFVNTC